MDNSALEANLRLRIEQSREWAQQEVPKPLTVRYQGYEWLATPVEFLDNPSRVERFGVALDFSLKHTSKKLGVLLKAFIKPEATISEKDDSPPYFVYYVTNRKTGTDECLGFHKFRRPSSYTGMASLSIEDWYRKCFAHVSTSSGSRKVFNREMNLYETY